MIKVITLLSKREGLNRDEFRQYYEEHHRRLGEKYLTGRACRYLRRYVCPEDPATQYGSSPDFDVLMEVWFPDQGLLQEAMTVMATPEAQAETPPADPLGESIGDRKVQLSGKNNFM